MVRKTACLALTLFAALPAAAQAADFCVAPNTTCGGMNVGGLQLALGLADNATDGDRIFLGAGTYTAGPAGFVYDAPGSPVEIIGAGVGSTTLTAPSGSTRVMNLQGGPGSLIRDLMIAMPAGLPAAPLPVGLETGSPARNLGVVSDPTNTVPHHGIDLDAGGSLSGSTITMSQAIEAIGVEILGANAAVADSTISARTGVRARGGNASIERVYVTSEGAGVLSYRPGALVRSSILRPILGGAGGMAWEPPAFNAGLTLDGVTIVGDGSTSPPTTGVLSNSESGGLSASLTLTNSILSNVTRSIAVTTGIPTGTASATASYSNYDPATAGIIDGPGTETFTPGLGNLNVDPLFAPGDFSLSAGSPLIDRGDPATPAGLDFRGAPLIGDGNGDGTARRDMGAFEYPMPLSVPPGSGAVADFTRASISGFRAVPKRFAVAPRKPKAGAAKRGTEFRWRLSESAAVTIAIARALPGRRAGGVCRRPTKRNKGNRRCTRYQGVGRLKAKGPVGAGERAFSGRFGRRALSPGRYRALIGAVDQAGNISKPRATDLRIVRPRPRP